MKTSRAVTLATIALAIGFFAARWCYAQPSAEVPRQKPASYDFGALKQLESFLSHLHDTRQTNTLQRFNDYTTASLASQNYADVGVTLAILKRLREGHHDQAYELLEGRLNVAIIGFVANYRQLPPSAQDQPGTKVLENAREYRAKFPFKHRHPTVDEGVANAFKVLDETAR